MHPFRRLRPRVVAVRGASSYLSRLIGLAAGALACGEECPGVGDLGLNSTIVYDKSVGQ